MRGADASSDHEMIRSKIRIKLKKQKQNKDSRRKKYDFKKKKIQQPEKKRAFTLELKNRFQVLDELKSIENIWEIMSKGYNETADNTLELKGQTP